MFSSTFALAYNVRHKWGVQTHHGRRGAVWAGSGILHSSYRNSNASADRPIPMSRTGSSKYDGSPHGTGCHGNCAPRDTPRDDWPADMMLD